MSQTSGRNFRRGLIGSALLMILAAGCGKAPTAKTSNTAGFNNNNTSLQGPGISMNFNDQGGNQMPSYQSNTGTTPPTSFTQPQQSLSGQTPSTVFQQSSSLYGPNDAFAMAVPGQYRLQFNVNPGLSPNGFAGLSYQITLGSGVLPLTNISGCTAGLSGPVGSNGSVPICVQFATTSSTPLSIRISITSGANQVYASTLWVLVVGSMNGGNPPAPSNYQIVAVGTGGLGIIPSTLKSVYVKKTLFTAGSTVTTAPSVFQVQLQTLSGTPAAFAVNYALEPAPAGTITNGNLGAPTVTIPNPGRVTIKASGNDSSGPVNVSLPISVQGRIDLAYTRNDMDSLYSSDRGGVSCLRRTAGTETYEISVIGNNGVTLKMLFPPVAGAQAKVSQIQPVDVGGGKRNIKYSLILDPDMMPGEITCSALAWNSSTSESTNNLKQNFVIPGLE